MGQVIPDLVIGTSWAAASEWCARRRLPLVPVATPGRVEPRDVRPGARVVVVGEWPDQDRDLVRVLTMLRDEGAVIIPEDGVRGP